MLIKLVLIIYFTLILVFTYLVGPDLRVKILFELRGKSEGRPVVPN